jgi:MYXO-CTERM domain-containing protein
LRRVPIQEIMPRMKTSLALAAALAAFSAASTASATVHQLTATLDGAQEVPPAATAATGTGTFTYDDVTKKLNGTVTFSGLSANVTAAHIHQGAVGVNGPDFVTLGTTSPITITDEAIEDAQETALLASGTYVNIHTEAPDGFPAGEIRGQIVPASPADAGADAAGPDPEPEPEDAGSSGSSGATTERSDAGTTPPAPAADDGGCSCSTTGSSPATGLFGLGALLAASLLMRRSRRR